MNPLTRPLRTIAALAFLLGIPTASFAANKTWVSMTATPPTTNITAGVAANLTSVIALRNGSGASARYVGPASLTISVSPADPNITASVNPTTLTYPNSDTTLSATVSVATTSLLLSNTYVVTITANTNPVSGSVTPTNCTFTISMVTAPPFDPVKLWSAGVNGNWSTAGNWTPGGAPTSVNDVRFSDTGVVGTSATVNNTVDASFTIGSLTYGQTNNYHTTLISPGLTLALTGTNGLNAGTGTAAGDGIQTVTTVQGAGAALLVNNPNAIINVDQSQPISGLANSTTMATLDLSGLDTFTANVSRVLVGVDTAATLRGACGVLNLAQTNRITVVPGSAAPQIDIGDNTQTGTSPGLPSILLLGRTNAIFADSIAVGRGKSATSGGSSMLFNSSFANSTAFLRGTNGDSSRVGLWTIGDAWGAKSSQNSGASDFTLGNVDALVNQMFVGRGASVAIANGANVAGVGTLSIGAGRFDVNSLEVGYGIDAAGAGTININGGALVANSNFELAHGVGSIGIVTVSGGTSRPTQGSSRAAVRRRSPSARARSTQPTPRLLLELWLRRSRCSR